MFGVSNISGLSQIENEEFKKLINYNGFYRGFVVSTDDPKHLGRVKVRIPAIHGSDPSLETYMADNTLPWAQPGAFNLAGPGMGQLILPYVGSVVWVTFEVDQPNCPIYFGNLYSTKPMGEKFIQGSRHIYQGTQLQCKEDDLGMYDSAVYNLLTTLKGASITIDDSDMREKIEFKDVFGQYIRFTNLGELLYYGRTPNKDNCEIEIASGNSSLVVKNSGIQLKGKLPYQTYYFIDVSKVSDDLLFVISKDSLFTDKNLITVSDSILNGARIVYINSDRDIVGFGVITNITSEGVFISNGIVLDSIISRNPYPVGSYYYCSADVDPNKEFGGVWEKTNSTEPICWKRVS